MYIIENISLRIKIYLIKCNKTIQHVSSIKYDMTLKARNGGIFDINVTLYLYYCPMHIYKSVKLDIRRMYTKLIRSLWSNTTTALLFGMC